LVEFVWNSGGISNEKHEVLSYSSIKHMERRNGAQFYLTKCYSLSTLKNFGPIPLQVELGSNFLLFDCEKNCFHNGDYLELNEPKL
jgi:hypothetical protein